MPQKKLLALLLVPLLVACSDQRAAFEFGSPEHSLTLIRVQNFFWEKTAGYSIVAAHLPECQRRHDMGAVSYTHLCWLTRLIKFMGSAFCSCGERSCRRF